MDSDVRCIAEDVEAVITSYNQGEMLLEAVRSVCRQTMLPKQVIVVDDGSTEEASLQILDRIQEDSGFPVPVLVVRRTNGGVSAARNTGIRRTEAPLVLVLDGDDKLKDTYIERVSACLRRDSSVSGASSWMRAFGVLEAEIRPCGGDIAAFLSRNCCPATHILRRKSWEACGGYDESMRSGFEDWDFFLSMLEAAPHTRIEIVQEPLLAYRTAPASSNITSMSRRLELFRFLIEKHSSLYQTHIADAVLGVEAISMSRLLGWETEISRLLEKGEALSEASKEFMKNPSYGDGGMAAAVRIASLEKSRRGL